MFGNVILIVIKFGKLSFLISLGIIHGFEKLYQTRARAFQPISKHLEVV